MAIYWRSLQTVSRLGVELNPEHAFFEQNIWKLLVYLVLVAISTVRELLFPFYRICLKVINGFWSTKKKFNKCNISIWQTMHRCIWFFIWSFSSISYVCRHEHRYVHCYHTLKYTQKDLSGMFHSSKSQLLWGRFKIIFTNQGFSSPLYFEADLTAIFVSQPFWKFWKTIP